MRALLFSLFFLSLIQAEAQVNTTIAGDSIYTPEPYVAVKYTIIDSFGKEQPYIYSKMEFYPMRADGYPFCIVSADDHHVIAHNYPKIPQQYYHMVKYDPENETYLRPKIKGDPLPDSIMTVDKAVLDSLYTAPGYLPDTILVKNDRVMTSFDFSISSSDFCQYKGDVKDGYEITYYCLSDLAGVVVNDNFRKKSSGFWKDGRKTGNWFYYSKDGTVYKTEHWRNGKLKHEWKAK